MPEPRLTDSPGVPGGAGDPGEGRPGPAPEPTISEQFGWLFRSPDDQHTAPAPAPEDEQQTAVRPPSPRPSPSPARAVLPSEPAVEADEQRRGRRVGLIIALALVLVVLLGVGALLLTRTFGDDGVAAGPARSPDARVSAAPSTADGTDSPASAEQSPASGSNYAGPARSPDFRLSPAPSTADGTDSPAPAEQSPASGSNYAGPVVAVRATDVTADCQAPAAVDDAGAKVSYEPSLTEDGDDATAWRCDGSGVGKTLTLTLPEGSKVAELGLVNGYAKTDPKTDKDRYGEYRRITAVSWILDDGVTVSQILQDGPEDPQTIRIPTTETRQVMLRIDASTEPGSGAATRDAVLISEISVGTPQ